MQSIRKCLERCLKKGGKEKDDGYDDSANRTGSVDDDSWGEWDDDIENQSSSRSSSTKMNDSNFQSFGGSRKRSGSGGVTSPNVGKDDSMVGNSSTPLMYTSNVTTTGRSSRPRNTSWMMKNKKKNSSKRSSRQSDSASNVFASKKGEDIFADVGIERRNISKQSKLRVQKRIELKGNVSSRFQDDSDSDVVGDAWGD